MAVATGIASALQCIHDRNIVHRDVTLGNIMWRSSDRTAKLMDFGISVKLGQTRLTQHGCAVGTPLYMAPEVFKGGPDLSAATDIYSFGACLYHLITGRPPFTAENAIELARQHLSRQADPMASVRPGVAPEWDELIVSQCLAKIPSERPQSVDTILSELAVLRESPF